MTRPLYTNIGSKSTDKVFLDTNVAVDLAIKREPFYRESEFVERLGRDQKISMQISAGSVTIMIFLAFERYKISNASDLLHDFISMCAVVNPGKITLLRSLRSTFHDKEDAYQYYTAIESKADYFVTRDKKDFTHVTPYLLPVLSPLQFEYMLL